MVHVVAMLAFVNKSGPPDAVMGNLLARYINCAPDAHNTAAGTAGEAVNDEVAAYARHYTALSQAVAPACINVPLDTVLSGKLGGCAPRVNSA